MHPVQVFSRYERTPTLESKGYNHCPSCGKKLALPASRTTRLECAVCGWVYYRNPLPGVVVLISDGDRVLLGKRGKSSYAAGKWCLPGGFMEYDEDFLTAAIREVREETGLEIQVQSILSVVSNFLSPKLHTLVVVLLGKVAGGTPGAGDDLCELRWFAPGEPLPDMAFEADRHIVERFRSTAFSGAPVDPRFASSISENSETRRRI